MGPDFGTDERMRGGGDPWLWREEGAAAAGRRPRRSRGPGRRPGRGRGGWDRGYGRRANRGDVRAAILALLAEEPMHGYQIIRELEERTAGAWKPSPGSVYPTLQMLEDEGVLRSESEGGRNVFHLTDEGRTAAAAGDPEPWSAVVGDAGQAGIRDVVGGLMAAFTQVVRTGSPDQVDRARKVLNDARKALYGILSEDVEEI